MLYALQWQWTTIGYITQFNSVMKTILKQLKSCG
jgi:hypothetical protein